MFKSSQAHLTNNAPTEKRLLEAAGEVFAEHGYRAATVRQICEKAAANIAAVNYYFGDKEGLYKAVLRSVPDDQARKYPAYLGLDARASAETKLRAYVQSLLLRVFDEGRPGWHAKIIARELIEPSHAFDNLLEEFARPLHQELCSIVSQLLGPRACDEAVRLCALSVLSQCVYYRNARSVVSRLYPQQKYGIEDIGRLADHITDFSLGALRSYRRNEDRGRKLTRSPIALNRTDQPHRTDRTGK